MSDIKTNEEEGKKSLNFIEAMVEKDLALACPICRYPFGSGGKRVCTRPLFLPSAKSFSTIKNNNKSNNKFLQNSGFVGKNSPKTAFKYTKKRKVK